MAKEYNIRFFETSAKQDLNVENSFLMIAKDVIERLIAAGGGSYAPTRLTPTRDDDGEVAIHTPAERTPPPPPVNQPYSLSSPFPSAPSPESIDSPPSACSSDDGVGREVSDFFAAEEELLNLHMASLQENAELLTRESQLLKAVQAGEFSGAEEYVNQLEAILNRKVELVVGLQAKLAEFRGIMQAEDSY